MSICDDGYPHRGRSDDILIVWIWIYLVTVMASAAALASGSVGDSLTRKTFSAAPPDQPKEALDERVSAAVRLLQGYDHPAKGERELLDVATRHPQHAPVHFYLGLLATHRGQHNKAVALYAATLRAGTTFFLLMIAG